MSKMGSWYIEQLNAERAQLTDEYLADCESRARRYQGQWTGTAGSLAADVMRLLWEVQRLKVQMAYVAEGRRLPALEPMPD